MIIIYFRACFAPALNGSSGDCSLSSDLSVLERRSKVHQLGHTSCQSVQANPKQSMKVINAKADFHLPLGAFLSVKYSNWALKVLLEIIKTLITLIKRSWLFHCVGRYPNSGFTSIHVKNNYPFSATLRSPFQLNRPLIWIRLVFWITIVFGQRAHLIRGHLSLFHGKAYFKRDKNNFWRKGKINCHIEKYFLIASCQLLKAAFLTIDNPFDNLLSLHKQQNRHGLLLLWMPCHMVCEYSWKFWYSWARKTVNDEYTSGVTLVYFIPESSLLSLILVSLGVVSFRLLKVPSDMSVTTGRHVDIIS